MISALHTTKTFFAVVAFILAFSLFGASVEARSVVRSGETISIAEDQTIEGDFYVAAGKVNISGSVEEDIVSAAGQITINGPIGRDALLMAGQVNVHGTIGDNLRILSGEVTIAEPVMGDVFVMGGVVNILSTASVTGDVVVFAGEATIEGTVGGDIIGTLETLRIDAQVAGDVDVTVSQLTLGDRANIEGSVDYVSSELVIQALNATVGGELVRSDPILPISNSSAHSAFIPILILLFSILVWYWISRKSLQKVVDRALIHSPRPFLTGFLTMMLAPIVIGMLFVSFIGSVVAAAGLLAYLLLGVLSLVGLSAVVGRLLMKAFNKPTYNMSLISLVAGVIGVALLLLLPFIGHLIFVGLMILTLGSMVDLLIRPNLK